MRNLLQLFLTLTICMIISIHTFSQSYKTGIGIRVGGLTNGLTVKHFIKRNAALEGILSAGYRSFIITGLYEVHQPIQNANGLKFLYGGGAHIGFFNDGGYYYYYRGNVYYNSGNSSTAVVGIDGILGLEYKFNRAPFTVGVDIKPFADFFNGTYIFFDGAFTARFVF